ncbi:hypothetical protein LJB76_00525, partial [Clostridia bacterium OttesenSCG-928-O13]|nr:hypothetical protein [Clostridia bacterium OttesenSCG-928-O13]
APPQRRGYGKGAAGPAAETGKTNARSARPGKPHAAQSYKGGKAKPYAHKGKNTKKSSWKKVSHKWEKFS